MPQLTLDSFVLTIRPCGQPSISHATSFLDLPYDIRRRVYSYAGLSIPRSQPIWLNYLAPLQDNDDDDCPLSHLGVELEDIPAEQDVSPYTQSLSRFLHGPLAHPSPHLDLRCRCKVFDLFPCTNNRYSLPNTHCLGLGVVGGRSCLPLGTAA